MSAARTDQDSTRNGLSTSDITVWHPGRFLSRDNELDGYALLVLNQPIENLEMLKLVWEKAGYRIAADGGGNRVYKAFQDPCLSGVLEKKPLQVIHGDLDSLSPKVRSWAHSNNVIVSEDSSQDTTDFTKCINYLKVNYKPQWSMAPPVVCLGGLGGRVDQALSVIHHLYQTVHGYPSTIYLLSSECIVFLLPPGKHEIYVRDPKAPVLGKHIGIIPVGEPAVITTKGLEWDVENWETKFGGQISTSNWVKDDMIEVETNSTVLFSIDLNFPDGDHDH